MTPGQPEATAKARQGLRDALSCYNKALGDEKARRPVHAPRALPTKDTHLNQERKLVLISQAILTKSPSQADPTKPSQANPAKSAAKPSQPSKDG